MMTLRAECRAFLNIGASLWVMEKKLDTPCSSASNTSHFSKLSPGLSQAQGVWLHSSVLWVLGLGAGEAFAMVGETGL